MNKATLQRALNARPQELSFLLLLLLINLLLNIGTEMVDNIAEMIFVRRVGVDQLPTLFAIEPVAVVLILLAVGKLLDQTSNRTLFFIGTNLIFMLVLLFSTLFIRDDGVGIYYVLFVLQRVLFAVGGVVFWLVANDLVDIEQAKRLFAGIVAAGIGGKLLGNLLTALLALALPAELILLAAAPLFAGCIGAILWLRRINHPHPAWPVPASTREPISLFLPRKLLKLPFVMAFIWLSLIVSLGDTVLRYQFNTVLNQSLHTEQGLIATYSLFKTGAGILVFLFQVFLAGHLVRYLGVPGSLNVQPMLTIAAFLLISLNPQLIAVASTVALLSMLHFGLYTSARKTTVNIFPTDQRGRFSAFSKQLIYLGKLAGALFLFAVADNLSWAALSWLSAGVIGTWLLFLPRFQRHYAEACLHSRLLPLDGHNAAPPAAPPAITLPAASFRDILQTLFHREQQQLALVTGGFMWRDASTNGWISSLFVADDPRHLACLHRALRSTNIFVRRGAQQIFARQANSRDAILRAVDTQMKIAFELMLLTAPLRNDSGAAVTWDKLNREKQVACRQAALTLLETLYPPNQMRAINRMLRSPQPHKNATAIESLENLLPRNLTRHLLALARLPEDKIQQYAGQQFHLHPPATVTDALHRLVGFPDSTVNFWGLRESQKRGIISNGVRGSVYACSDLPTPTAKLLFGASTFPQDMETIMELAQKIEFLRDVAVFAPLEEDDLRVVALCMRQHHFDAGQMIAEEGQPGDAFYVITAGQVELLSMARQQTLQLLGSGQTFGEVAFFTEKPHPLTAVTLSAAAALSIDRESLRELIHYYPNVALGLTHGLADQVDRLTNLVQIVQPEV